MFNNARVAAWMVIAAFVGATTLASRAGAAEKPPLEKVRIGAINLMVFSPVFLARELGYFRDEGLDVEIVETKSGHATMAALLKGEVAAAATGFTQPFTLAEQGQSVQSLVGMEMASIYVFVASPKLAITLDNPAELGSALKGRKLGVADIGSSGHVVAEGVLRESGFDPKDRSVIAVGTGASAIKALNNGAADVLITYEPDLSAILAAGVGKIVLDLRNTRTEKIFSHLPTSTVQATSAWIESHPEEAAKLVRAIVRANKTIRDEPQKALPVLAKLYPTIKAEHLRAIYEAERFNFRSRIPDEQCEFAQWVYMRTGQIKRSVPCQQVVAKQFTQLWAR
jgi:NitT/TauT family transport system substrate-binding protein